MEPITDAQVERARVAAAEARVKLATMARRAKAAADQAKDDRASDAIRRYLPKGLR